MKIYGERTYAVICRKYAVAGSPDSVAMVEAGLWCLLGLSMGLV